jgi:hypothetical protein
VYCQESRYFGAGSRCSCRTGRYWEIGGFLTLHVKCPNQDVWPDSQALSSSVFKSPPIDLPVDFVFVCPRTRLVINNAKDARRSERTLQRHSMYRVQDRLSMLEERLGVDQLGLWEKRRSTLFATDCDARSRFSSMSSLVSSGTVVSEHELPEMWIRSCRGSIDVKERTNWP